MHGPKFGRAQTQQVVFLKPLVQSPFTDVGDYTYYADAKDPLGFERNNVLFHYGPERLILGKYTAIAAEARFVMAAANHRRSGASTFPFPMLGGDWLAEMDLLGDRAPSGDTVVGNDVWLGYRVTVMPGVRVGDGAIVAAGSVVAHDVPPYAVVAGNPTRVVRMRFPDDDVDRLLRLAWWDWPVDVVTRHVRQLMTCDADVLEAVARENGLLAGDEAPADVASAS